MASKAKEDKIENSSLLVCISDDEALPIDNDSLSDSSSKTSNYKAQTISDLEDDRTRSALDDERSKSDLDDDRSKSAMADSDNESNDLLKDSDNEEQVKILEANEGHDKKQSQPMNSTSCEQQVMKPSAEIYLFEDGDDDFEPEPPTHKGPEPEKVKPKPARQGPILMDALPQPHRRAFNRSISEQTSKQGSRPVKKNEPAPPKLDRMFQKKALEIDRPKSRTEQAEERKQKLREVAKKERRPEKPRPSSSRHMGVMKSSMPKNKKIFEVKFACLNSNFNINNCCNLYHVLAA